MPSTIALTAKMPALANQNTRGSLLGERTLPPSISRAGRPAVSTGPPPGAVSVAAGVPRVRHRWQ